MRIFHIGFILIVIGFIMAFAAALLLVLLPLVQQLPEGVSGIGGAGCIILFFIPICFGFGPQAFVWPLIIATLVLAVAAMVIGYAIYRYSIRIAKEFRKEYG
ncbi:MAG: hypothetical protein LM572_04650 [Ignisphaera sp.]|jgi:uncharacterized membrane protein|nr:hypothetical protein [Ignisphaera sp.]MCC6056723.1 hypothetical protein [Desulfurococcaceae archaeon]